MRALVGMRYLFSATLPKCRANRFWTGQEYNEIQLPLWVHTWLYLESNTPTMHAPGHLICLRALHRCPVHGLNGGGDYEASIERAAVQEHRPTLVQCRVEYRPTTSIWPPLLCLLVSAPASSSRCEALVSCRVDHTCHNINHQIPPGPTNHLAERVNTRYRSYPIYSSSSPLARFLLSFSSANVLLPPFLAALMNCSTPNGSADPSRLTTTSFSN